MRNFFNRRPLYPWNALDKPFISTKTGCRIYATSPVMLQDKIDLADSENKTDENNLQIVSAEAIFPGVGREKCDTTAKPVPMPLMKIV